jgi:hypothetical protein
MGCAQLSCGSKRPTACSRRCEPGGLSCFVLLQERVGGAARRACQLCSD